MSGNKKNNIETESEETEMNKEKLYDSFVALGFLAGLAILAWLCR